MSIGRTLTVTKRIFRGLKNDWRSLVMMFITPAVAMAVFGIAFSDDVNGVEVVVVNQDEGYRIPPSTVPVSIAEAIVANLDTDVLVVREAATEAEAEDIVRRGDAYGMIIFPEHFTSNIYEKQLDPMLSADAAVRMELDRSNVSVSGTILRVVSEAMVKTSESMGVEAPVTVDSSNAVYAKDASYRDFSVPGLMAFIIFILTFVLTLLTFVNERTSGVLSRLSATPLKETELVMGYTLAFSVIAVIQTIMTLAIIVGVFKVMVVGSLFLAFLVMAFLAVFSLSLGILLSSAAKSEAQAIQFLPIVALPVFLLGNIFWPVEGIPVWMRPLSYAIPPSYAVTAIRAVMLRGWGIDRVWVQLVALAGFSIVCLALSVLLLRRERNQ
jgi:ABC-2 type transport system permease protein